MVPPIAHWGPVIENNLIILPLGGAMQRERERKDISLPENAPFTW